MQQKKINTRSLFFGDCLEIVLGIEEGFFCIIFNEFQVFVTLLAPSGLFSDPS
jgi:hypothetical protein